MDGPRGPSPSLPTDKTGRDFRAQGRLQYVGKHYLQFAGSGSISSRPVRTRRRRCSAMRTSTAPSRREADEASALKTWAPHVRDWQRRRPDVEGRQGQGTDRRAELPRRQGRATPSPSCTYNAGGDGDNVWPFVDARRQAPLRLLEARPVGHRLRPRARRWGSTCTSRLQENEIDDKAGASAGRAVPESLDGGELGAERKLYCRELDRPLRPRARAELEHRRGEHADARASSARWRSTFRDTDPYQHHVVIHTFPDQQDKVYTPLLGEQSALTGASLQNGWNAAHQRTLKWVTRIGARPASRGSWPTTSRAPPAPACRRTRAIEGFDGTARRRRAAASTTCTTSASSRSGASSWPAARAWNTTSATQLPQNDLVCEDWRSRERSWDYAASRSTSSATSASRSGRWSPPTPWSAMPPRTTAATPSRSAASSTSSTCPKGGTAELDLAGSSGRFTVAWLDPRKGGPLQEGSVREVAGGGKACARRPSRGRDG